MKRYTWSQLYNSFAKAIADDYRSNDILKALASTPFYKTIVNIVATCSLYDGSDERWFQIPVNILVKDADVKRAILMEIATQLHKFGELSYYKDEAPILEFKDVNIICNKVYSFETNQYAIFHEEQECGFSWYTIDTTTLSAPFTYEHDYNTKALRRSETNALEKHFINRKR